MIYTNSSKKITKIPGKMQLSAGHSQIVRFGLVQSNEPGERRKFMSLYKKNF